MENDVLLLRRVAPGSGNKEAWIESKGKGSMAMKAARNREEQFYDPTHQKHIQGRPQTRLGLWEERLKRPVAALAKAPECLEAAYECYFLGVSRVALLWRAFSTKGGRCCWCKRVWEEPCWEGMWRSSRSVGPASVWNVNKKYGPYDELFFFEKKKNRWLSRPLSSCDFSSGFGRRVEVWLHKKS